MSVNNKRTDKYKLLYQWLTNPEEFFNNLIKKFNQLSQKKQNLFFILSYLMPIIAGTLFFSFIAQFGIWEIIDQYVSTLIAWTIFVIISLVISLTFLTYNPGRSIKLYFNAQINEKLKEIRNDVKQVKLKNFNKSTLFRNNFFFLPIISVLLIANIGVVGKSSNYGSWNFYYLSLYFAVIIITTFLWTIVFIVESVTSVKYIFSGYIQRKNKNNYELYLENLNIPKMQYLSKAVIVIISGFLMYMGINYLLDIWLGATNMPLWNKLAMLFMHGQ
ncbi:MAG: hypothetical protein ACTSQJ_12215 [Promethearchaeota archaeon]